MKISIIGSGVYGLALAHTIGLNKKQQVYVWTEQQIHEEQDNIIISNNYQEVIENTNLILICTSSKFYIDTIKNMQPYYNNQPILIGTKGFTDTDGYFYDIITKELLKTQKCGYFAGPTFAKDFYDETPFGLTVATDKDTYILFKRILPKYAHLEYINEAIGLEICSVTKNIIALGCGLLKGINMNESAITLYLMNSVKEVSLLLKHFQSNSSILFTYGGFGDLYLTTKDESSRNFTYGFKLAQNDDLKEFENNNTVEGKVMLEILINIIKKEDLNLPLFTSLYEIIYCNKEINLLNDLNNL